MFSFLFPKKDMDKNINLYITKGLLSQEYIEYLNLDAIALFKEQSILNLVSLDLLTKEDIITLHNSNQSHNALVSLAQNKEVIRSLKSKLYTFRDVVECPLLSDLSICILLRTNKTTLKNIKNNFTKAHALALKNTDLFKLIMEGKLKIDDFTRLNANVLQMLQEFSSSNFVNQETNTIFTAISNSKDSDLILSILTCPRVQALIAKGTLQLTNILSNTVTHAQCQLLITPLFLKLLEENYITEQDWIKLNKKSVFINNFVLKIFNYEPLFRFFCTVKISIHDIIQSNFDYECQQALLNSRFRKLIEKGSISPTLFRKEGFRFKEALHDWLLREIEGKNAFVCEFINTKLYDEYFLQSKQFLIERLSEPLIKEFYEKGFLTKANIWNDGYNEQHDQLLYIVKIAKEGSKQLLRDGIITISCLLNIKYYYLIEIFNIPECADLIRANKISIDQMNSSMHTRDNLQHILDPFMLGLIWNTNFIDCNELLNYPLTAKHIERIKDNIYLIEKGVVKVKDLLDPEYSVSKLRAIISAKGYEKSMRTALLMGEKPRLKKEFERYSIYNFFKDPCMDMSMLETVFDFAKDPRNTESSSFAALRNR